MGEAGGGAPDWNRNLGLASSSRNSIDSRKSHTCKKALPPQHAIDTPCS